MSRDFTDACNICGHLCILDNCITYRIRIKVRRICLLLLVAVLSAVSLFAENDSPVRTESEKVPFAIKAYPFRGMYLDKNTHFNKFQPFNPAGVHMGVEFPSMQQRPWQQYLGNPTVGVGLSWLDFGHEMVGMGFAVYPYILLDAIDTKHFRCVSRLLEV